MVTGGNATVFISNMDQAIRFYTETLGMKLTAHFGNDWATVEAGGFAIGLHPMGKTNPEPGTPGSIHVGLLVDDIQAAPAKLAAGGAKSIGEPKQGSGGPFVHFQDPDGNDIYLWQM